MSLYRIKATCPDPLWRHMPVCEIGISPGNPSHDGDKLSSILEWSSQKFQQGILTLSDTMYRHNFMASGAGEQEALGSMSRMKMTWEKLEFNSLIYWRVPCTRI